MTPSGDTHKHVTSDRMAERAERWAQAVADARAAEARRVAAAEYAPSSGGTMRDAVRAAQDKARQAEAV